jgi:hypothetical protein|tara:strand:- start:28 stop:480 length:453 start_codon:yes stop_codon:yes gene_type:complete
MTNVYAPEPIPAQEVKELLNTYWDVTTTGKIPNPTYVVVTGASQEIRHDLTKGDLLVVRAGNWREEIIGNYTYGNRYYEVFLEVFTLNQRQRLYDIMQEVKRVVHSKKHSMDNYQRIAFTDFEDKTDDTFNVWEGRISLELQNAGVLLET